MSIPKKMLAIAVVWGIAVAGFVADAPALTLSQIADTGTLEPRNIAIDQGTGDIYVVVGIPGADVGISKVTGGGIIPVYADIDLGYTNGLTAGDGYLFWGNANSGPVTDSQIFRAPQSGSGPITAIYTGVYVGQPIFDVSDLAYQADQVYSVDYAYGRVVRLDSDGSNIQVLMWSSPHGVYEKGEFIALSSDKIFVADATGGNWSTTPGGIYSAPIGGGSWTILAGTGEFGDIAFLNDTVYTIAADGYSIWQIPASGGSASVLVGGSPFGALHSIAAYNGRLYVTDTSLHKVWRVSFAPSEAIEDIIEDIAQDFDLPEGIEDSLVSKLENAIDSLNKGQDNAAVNKLEAFINQVEAQRGKKLTDEEADKLVARVQAIIDSI
ncbi:MAG: hypothetical protein JSW47_13330 [Phycisphaerales bacterium]|nr:MAG: hypothetical protein JSW47_13330 [Phycisphaerales bacterium]UCF17360.1 MAG: hypothetical protein JSW59_07825 [Phycisphaerales bacterium]